MQTHSCQQAPARQEDVGQRGGHERPRGVLRQTAVAHLAEAHSRLTTAKTCSTRERIRDLARLTMRSSPPVRLPLRTVLFVRSTAPGALVWGSACSARRMRSRRRRAAPGRAADRAAGACRARWPRLGCPDQQVREPRKAAAALGRSGESIPVAVSVHHWRLHVRGRGGTYASHRSKRLGLDARSPDSQPATRCWRRTSAAPLPPLPEDGSDGSRVHTEPSRIADGSSSGESELGVAERLWCSVSHGGAE